LDRKVNIGKNYVTQEQTSGYYQHFSELGKTCGLFPVILPRSLGLKPWTIIKVLEDPNQAQTQDFVVEANVIQDGSAGQWGAECRPPLAVCWIVVENVTRIYLIAIAPEILFFAPFFQYLF
jgi:hypothetical protein